MDRRDNNNANIMISEIIKNNIEDFDIRSIKRLGEGWNSNTYLVNDEYVFRFPKEEDGSTDLKKEIKVLPKLKEIVSLKIPDFKYIGKQKNVLRFVGYKIIKGKILNNEEFSLLPNEVKNKIAEQISKFMNEINSFSIDCARELGVFENNFYEDYTETFEVFKEKVFPVIDNKLQKYITMKFKKYIDDSDNFKYISKLIHADLSLNHLMYNQIEEKIEGIIDFGDIQIGDPDFEYIYLLDDCGIEFTKKVMQLRNEKNIEVKLKKISFFLTVDKVGIILEGIRIANKKMIEDGIKALKKEFEELV